MNQTIAFQPEYNAIVKHYGDKRAERSGVRLINHINEGLHILNLIGASMDAQRAYCLHPLIQEDSELSNMASNDVLFSFSPRVILLAMEYRQRANDWLSDKVYKKPVMDKNGYLTSEITHIGSPESGALKEVKQMLIADKVQNYKDFEKYHLRKHERSGELQYYFIEWLIELNVTRTDYENLIAHIP